ncbi:CCDC90 family protein [Methylosinus sp. Sm6]|nr:CCDC90 family protein [Methylosinus sp. Sm6]
MSALLFDTLRLSRTLRDKGRFSSEQAETLAEALGEAMQGDLATKADVSTVRVDLDAFKADLASVKTDVAVIKLELSAVKTDVVTIKSDLGTLRAELKSSISDAKTDILKWVVGAIGFQTILILGGLISLARVFAK